MCRRKMWWRCTRRPGKSEARAGVAALAHSTVANNIGAAKTLACHNRCVLEDSPDGTATQTFTFQ